MKQVYSPGRYRLFWLLLFASATSIAQPGSDAEHVQTERSAPTPTETDVGQSHFSGEMGRQLAVGRLRNRFAQDIDLLKQMSELVSRLRQLAPYRELLPLLPQDLGDAQYIRDALGRLAELNTARDSSQQPSDNDPAELVPQPVSPIAPARPTAESPRVALIQPAANGRRARVIFQRGEHFETKRQGQQLSIGGRQYRVSRIEAAAVTLQSEPDGNSLVLPYSGEQW